MTIYKQYDSRWAKKNYNGSSTIGTAACGPFSVANIVVEHNPINPLDVVRYMQKNGYAIRHQGTAWAGIPAALKAEEDGFEGTDDAGLLEHLGIPVKVLANSENTPLAYEGSLVPAVKGRVCPLFSLTA